MSKCTRLALILSLAACEHVDGGAGPKLPAPSPEDPGTRAETTTHEPPAPKPSVSVPKPAPTPELPEYRVTTRAGTRWPGQREGSRVAKKPVDAGAPEKSATPTKPRPATRAPVRWDVESQEWTLPKQDAKP